jgi:alpha-beta hydrolase superfamily lysophospholipase
MTPMKLGAVLVVAALAAAGLFAQDAAWQLSQQEAPVAGTDVRETRWQMVRPPGRPADRIQLHRYRGTGRAKAALLYLPGTNMNGQVAVAGEAHNLWTFLARRGVEVFTLDYRTHFVPNDGTVETTVLRDWDMDAFVGDIRAGARKARDESGQARLFVAGFSRGVTLAYAYVCAEPAAVAGLVALDGAFKHHAPKGQYDRAAEAGKLEASGGWANDVSGKLGWDNRQRMMNAAATHPSAPAQDAKFPTIAAQVGDLLYNAWRPGALANPVEGLSRPEILARLLAGYDRYYPAVQDVDGRSIADRDDDPGSALDDAWGELKIPIVYFGATGMGTEWLLNGIHSAGASGSTDVTINVLERYGHLDVVVGEHARRDVFEPTLAWILARAGSPPSSPR